MITLRSVALTLECISAIMLVGARCGRSGGLGQIRLGPWYLAWTGLVLGLLTTTWTAPQVGLVAQIDRASVLEALKVVSLAVAIWTAGYLLTLGRAATAVARKFGRLAAPGSHFRLRSPAVPWILASAATGARLLLLALGQYGYLGDVSTRVSASSAFAYPLSVAANLGVAALMIATVDLGRHGGARRRACVATLALIEIAFALISGMKGQFVITIASACVAYVAVRRRLPVRVLGSAALVFVFVVIPFNAAYRDLVRGHDSHLGTGAALSSAPDLLSSTVSDRGSGSAESNGTTKYLSGRLRGIDSIAIVVQRTPAIVPERDPRELVLAPILTVIPRALWPTKPIAVNGYTFNQDYYGADPSLYTAAAVSPIADLYRYGGLLVVAAGMFLLGGFCRIVDDVLHPFSDPRYVVIFVPIVLLFVTHERTYSDIIANFPLQFGVSLVVCRFAFRGVERVSNP
ncbi:MULTISPECIES: hypothetical protein [Parafrankia]|nr:MULTISPECIES: hypothetical protein [Parafrankia]MBE3199552.1 hypothetical protein [Parafrankia sp. CH37]